MKVPPYIWSSLAVVGLVGLVAGLGKAAQPRSSAVAPTSVAKQLMEVARQKQKAAEQDTDMLYRLADSHAGLSYLNAARMLTQSDRDLEAVTRINPGDLQAALQAMVQQAHEWFARSK